jgi:mRNA interferase MazF
VSKKTYHPDRGDIVIGNFFPAAGREIDKRRPAIVLSTIGYNRATGLCLVVPTTTDLTPGPLWILMPAGLLPQPSLILCDSIKSIDYRERSVEWTGKRVDRALLDAIIDNIMNVIDPVYTA